MDSAAAIEATRKCPHRPLIAYAHVGKSFAGNHGTAGVVAVDDVSLEVAEGEFLAIVGSSGSGKTTLLRLANRLIEADTGTIAIEGEDISRLDPIQLRRRIGYVFQSGGLFPHLSVAGNIGITPKLLGWPETRISARVDELLDLVRLDRAQYRDRLPDELSGGQRQRVGVARALAAAAAHRPDGRAVRRARSPDPRCARRRFSRTASQARPDHGHDHARHDGSASCSPTASR